MKRIESHHFIPLQSLHLMNSVATNLWFYGFTCRSQQFIRNLSTTSPWSVNCTLSIVTCHAHCDKSNTSNQLWYIYITPSLIALFQHSNSLPSRHLAGLPKSILNNPVPFPHVKVINAIETETRFEDIYAEF